MNSPNFNIKDHARELLRASQDSPFVVFICGPNFDVECPKPSARLRRKLIQRLKDEGFEVIIGEDEGLEDTRLGLGINAQDNELEYIRKYCNAIIVIADSVGSFCELGLFSWHLAHNNGVIQHNTDFILLVNCKYENEKSYLNEGPFAAVNGFGYARFVKFDNYCFDEIVTRLINRRGVHIVDSRGRHRKSKK